MFVSSSNCRATLSTGGALLRPVLRTLSAATCFYLPPQLRHGLMRQSAIYTVAARLDDDDALTVGIESGQGWQRPADGLSSNKNSNSSVISQSAADSLGANNAQCIVCVCCRGSNSNSRSPEQWRPWPRGLPRHSAFRVIC